MFASRGSAGASPSRLFALRRSAHPYNTKMRDAPIYLDHNSTTPIDPRVVEAMVRAWQDCGANPASQHAAGRQARRMLEEAREGIAELLGARTGGMNADRVIFTSGGTEANNLALRGLSPAAFRDQKPRLAISTIEHPSILATAVELERLGALVQRLPVDNQGIVQLPITLNTHVASVMLANNETGIIQPVETFAAICREGDAVSHTDAVQAIGKIPVHFRELGVDAMTVAPHKFHGPLGIGALVLRHAVDLQPQLLGGFQQAGLRPGTENVALVVGFHKALDLAAGEFQERVGRMHGLRDGMERFLSDRFPDLVIVGKQAPRRLPTSCLSFPGLNRQALVMALDLAGVACSTGSACASGSSEPSPVLMAMGLPRVVVEGAIRLSLGAFSTTAEVAEASRRILNTVNHLRSRNSA